MFGLLNTSICLLSCRLFYLFLFTVGDRVRTAPLPTHHSCFFLFLSLSSHGIIHWGRWGRNVGSTRCWRQRRQQQRLKTALNNGKKIARSSKTCCMTMSGELQKIGRRNALNRVERFSLEFLNLTIAQELYYTRHACQSMLATPRIGC